MIHLSDCKRCRYCRGKEEAEKRRRLLLHKARKDHFIAKRDAILSGKLAVITLRDELTGYFYRYDKAGRMIALGCGDNRGA